MKVRDIAGFVSGDLLGDPEVEISDIAAFENAGPGEISFVENSEQLSGEAQLTCVLAPDGTGHRDGLVVIEVEDPKLAFARIGQLLHPPKRREPEIHKTAIISDSASIGKDVFIGAYCVVGENASIGAGSQLRAGAKIGDKTVVGSDCVLHPNVFVEDSCRIGDRVVLHTGVVVGTDGFGFVRDKAEHVKFPQIGSVIIEDDVEIGANSCIDRGALDDTVIGAGTKIDNLVQIAHNVKIGKRVVIAAMSGVSGSAVIEDDCVVGGQVGFADHVVIEKGSVIGAKSAVFPGKRIRGGVWAGIPVQPLAEYKKRNASISTIPRLRNEIKLLKALIKKLENE